ncbi:hypothetical protein [Methanobrevibacter sp.]|uniref:hypothetical protein n=1 Tax=Methanobrevibacter sp. TaxID=66852 RepID=UPI0026E059BE|nr:hypothetical protein [Methanobrevibacter sp.]
MILLIISAAVLFIDSSVDNMNKLMPEISDGIVNGDSDYNEAVNLVNDKNYDESMNKAVSAGNNYNGSLEKLHLLQDNFTSDVNQVHKDYINSAISELELKIQAVDKLKDAIDCFEVNYNYTGTEYAYEANDFMDQSLEYRDARDSLVSKNPNLFKENFII